MSHDVTGVQGEAGAGKDPAMTTAGKLSRLGSIRKGAVWVLLAVLGFLLNDAYSAARDWATNKPNYLTALAEQQDKEFAALKDSLNQISNSISSSDREAFRQVRDVVTSIEKTNAGLIQQLALAKQENETLRKITSQDAGVSGGYDIILTEGAGLRIDATTTLGLTHVGATGVHINLTSAGVDQARTVALAPGASLAYQNASGNPCKLSLLSFKDGTGGSASFAMGCT